MSNPKVFEYAKEVGMTPLALMDKIREWQLPVKSHMAELDSETLAAIKAKLSPAPVAAEEPKKKVATRKAAPKKTEIAGPTIVKKDSKVAAPAAADVSAKSTVVRRKAAPAPVAKPVVEEKVAAPVPENIVEEKPVAAAVQPEKAAVNLETKKAPEALQASAEVKAEAVAEPAAPKPEVKTFSPARKKEVAIGASGIQSQSPMAPKRNIVGKMDLSRVQSPQYGGGRPQQSGGYSGPRSQGAGPGGAGGAPTPGRPGGFSSPNRAPVGGRNIRAGFVAQGPDLEQPVMPSDDFERNRAKTFDKKKRLEGGPGAAGAGGKEEVPEDFNAVEFRKREMVFQPKKKKILIGRDAKKTQITQPKASKRVLKIFGAMKVSDVAHEMGIKVPQLIKVLMTNGVMASMNTELDFDTIALISPEFGWEAQNIQKSAEEVATATVFGDLTAALISRPPVVTIMGHVDHGKTSLLDAIRSAKVAAGEAGGITQHIGAYSVKLDDGALITFLDTPGHEAFTAMRARGANATDIAVIVVAADDGMMPQTQEAVNHAKAAGVPIIIAVNKMDKPGANPDKIKQQLTELELVPEEWGGTTIYCPVSAMKKTGITELLEQIKLVAEMAELKANPERSGTGIVIEAKMERGRGPVATLLIKDGTVKVGQYIVAGTSRGKVRSLMNDKGERIQSVGPGMPAEVLGLDEVPQAGDRFDIVIDEATAAKMSGIRKEQALNIAMAASSKKVTLEELFSKVNKGDMKELSVILKADVHGSLEAVTGMISKLSTAEVKVRVIHSGVGGVNESDVLLAQTSKGIIIGFNVRPDTSAQAKAKQLGVDIRTYSIVYELVDELKKAMAGLLTPDIVEKVSGRAEVRNTFTVPKMGLIAGCFIVDGKIMRSNMVRLIRDNKTVYEGKIGSLKRFKDDAKEVAQGFECGIGIENFNDVKVGDIIEGFIKEEIARELGAPLEA